MRVSIPWSGFRSFTQHRQRPRNDTDKGFNPLVGIPVLHAGGSLLGWCLLGVCFNPLVGIPVLHADHPGRPLAPLLQFQSPGRDSGPSRWARAMLRRRTRSFQSPGRDSGPSRRSCSTSAYEQVGFQSPGRDSGPSRRTHEHLHRQARASFNPLVGIPVLHASAPLRSRLEASGFNPLVGIPVLHAPLAPSCWPRCSWFQSPGRDSGPSRRQFITDGSRSRAVSIPWSGFRSFTLTVPSSFARRATLFQSPGRDSGPSRAPARTWPSRTARFQSPGRDSGPSRLSSALCNWSIAPVSIPWSGFRSFTLAESVAERNRPLVFQSPGRDSGPSRP